MSENNNLDNIAVGDKVFYVHRYVPFFWSSQQVSWVASALVTKTTATRFEADHGTFLKKDGTSYGSDPKAPRYSKRVMYRSIEELQAHRSKYHPTVAPLPIDSEGKFEQNCYFAAKLLIDMGYKKEKFSLENIIFDEDKIRILQESIDNIRIIAEGSLK